MSKRRAPPWDRIEPRFVRLLVAVAAVVVYSSGKPGNVVALTLGAFGSVTLLASFARTRRRERR